MPLDKDKNLIPKDKRLTIIVDETNDYKEQLLHIFNKKIQQISDIETEFYKILNQFEQFDIDSDKLLQITDDEIKIREQEISTTENHLRNDKMKIVSITKKINNNKEKIATNNNNIIIQTKHINNKEQEIARNMETISKASQVMMTVDNDPIINELLIIDSDQTDSKTNELLRKLIIEYKRKIDDYNEEITNMKTEIKNWEIEILQINKSKPRLKQNIEENKQQLLKSYKKRKELQQQKNTTKLEFKKQLEELILKCQAINNDENAQKIFEEISKKVSEICSFLNEKKVYLQTFLLEFKKEINWFIEKHFIKNADVVTIEYQQDLQAIKEISSNINNDLKQQSLVLSCYQYLENLLVSQLKQNKRATFFAEIKLGQIVSFDFKYKQILRTCDKNDFSHLLCIKDFKKEKMKGFVEICLPYKFDREKAQIFMQLKNQKVKQIKEYGLISWKNNKNEVIEGLINFSEFLTIPYNFSSLVNNSKKEQLLESKSFDKIMKFIKVPKDKNNFFSPINAENNSNDIVKSCLKAIDDELINYHFKEENNYEKIIELIIVIEHVRKENEGLTNTIKQKLNSFQCVQQKEDIVEDAKQEQDDLLKKSFDLLSTIIKKYLPSTFDSKQINALNDTISLNNKQMPTL